MVTYSVNLTWSGAVFFGKPVVYFDVLSLFIMLDKCKYLIHLFTLQNYFLLVFFVLFQVQISRKFKLYMKKVLFPGGFSV